MHESEALTTSSRTGDGLSDPRRFLVWGTVGGLMLVPVLVIRTAAGTVWNPGDLVFLAILLAGVGGAYELAVRTKDGGAYLTALAIAVAAALLQVWINLAVGIIGSEDNPANWAYAGVLAVALVGASLSRLRPLGMAQAMAATATAQVLIFVIVLAVGVGFTGPITVFFAALWLISASLFRRAASERAGARSPLHETGLTDS